MEKLKKIVDIIKLKWLKDTLWTIILIVALVALFIGTNILVENLAPNDIDLTPEGLYSLTDETKEKIASLPSEDKFEIYLFDMESSTSVVDIAKQYGNINDNIEVEIIDSNDRRDLVSKYNVEAGYGTVVIVRGEKTKTFSAYDFSNYDYNLGKYIDITEQRFTNSIIGLSSIGKAVSVYSLTGHGERDIKTDMTLLQMYLELENYEVKNLDLLTTSKIPEDCASLIIASPEKDFAEIEANAIKEYIQNGGNILWLNNPLSAESETPNINSILEMYGVTIRQDGLVFEGEETKMVMDSPNLVIPTIGPSEVTENVTSVLLLNSGKLSFVEDEKLEELKVTKTDLLTSSEKSFFRTHLELGIDAGVSTANGEKAEEAVLGALLEKEISEDKTSSLVVIANTLFAEDQGVYVGSTAVSAIGFYNNRDLALNAISYLSDVEDSITIRKEVESTTYTATESQDRTIRIIIFTVPIVIIIIRNYCVAVKKKKKINNNNINKFLI